jgi:predicted dehydrogenase
MSTSLRASSGRWLPPTEHPVRLGIVGGGDIAHRVYLPVLKRVPDANIVAVFDKDERRAKDLLESVKETWPNATIVNSISALRSEAGVDAIYNLTPALVHYVVSKEALELGLHVFSEKPLGFSVEEASELIDIAGRRELLLQCAPGNTASPRFKWISDLIRSGVIGTPHLVTAQFTNLGPATWAPYIGDPRAFYEVGPVFDEGVYALHLMTGLLGPVATVQAISSIAIPQRVTRTKGSAGVEFSLTKPDQVLMLLAFQNGAIGQLLSSFAVCGSFSPGLEIHGVRGSISLPVVDSAILGGQICYPSVDSESPPGWQELVPPILESAAISKNVIGAGAAHFVDCLNHGVKSLLSAEQGRHIVEIVKAAENSSSTGEAVRLVTTFDLPL